MYSVVLMMAMTGGAEATEFGRRGCNGCYGGGYAGCSGYVSYGCNGCWGGGCHGGGLFRRNGGGGCYGYGGCYGGGCHGYTRGHGCCGSAVYSGCHGGYYGGCQGGMFHGPGHYQQGGPGVMPKKEMPIEPKKEKKTMLETAPATIIVTLPAESKLRVDGYQTTSTGERRTLITPAIVTGQDFVYTLQAELVREGRAVVQTQTVTVRGGETTAAPFTFSSQSVASR